MRRHFQVIEERKMGDFKALMVNVARLQCPSSGTPCWRDTFWALAQSWQVVAKCLSWLAEAEPTTQGQFIYRVDSTAVATALAQVSGGNVSDITHPDLPQ